MTIQIQRFYEAQSVTTAVHRAETYAGRGAVPSLCQSELLNAVVLTETLLEGLKADLKRLKGG